MKKIIYIFFFCFFSVKSFSQLQKKISKYNSKEFLEHQSNLNIPFNHARYSILEKELIKKENVHLSIKPFSYKKVAKHIDLDSQKSQFIKNKKTWLGRKFWNEHLITVKGKNYWLNSNLLLDLQFGKENSDIKYSFLNSRILQIQGGLGSKFSFSTTIYESQARFASFINEAISAEQWKTFASNGLVYGRGKSKQFKENGFDFPVSEGYLSFEPNSFFTFQFGQGKNLIGDGYRSLLLSDAAPPYTYFKITTSFWKIQYINLWTWMSDIRFGISTNNSHPRKYVSTHYLSININKRLNVGLYEAVITDNSRTRNLDMDFVNPIIFYKSIEFARGEDAGSSVIGFNIRYNFSDKFSMYSQFVFDEFILEELKAQKGYWGNKYAFQLGIKYFDAFKIENLYLQGELNLARPYTFSHKIPIYNYGHYGQPIAHPWGANFWESVAIIRYQKNRWAANIKVVFGQKGFDIDEENYGGDIFVTSETRVKDYENKIAQGDKSNILNSDLQISYLLNPRTDLKIFGGLLFRKFSPKNSVTTLTEDSTTWFTFGLKVDLFNWYLDF